MKSVKKIEKLYNEILSNSNSYTMSFEIFNQIAKTFIEDVKNTKLEIELVKVYGRGMYRTFSCESKWDNLFLNAVYHRTFDKKNDNKEIRISGCGMDMHWHLLFSVCEEICTNGEIEKFRLNAKCSRNPIFKIVRGERVYL